MMQPPDRCVKSGGFIFSCELTENDTLFALLVSVKPILLVTVTCLLLCCSASAGLRVEVDLSDRVLSVVEDGVVTARYPVAIGTDSYPTPEGRFVIRKVIWNPKWVPPDSKWARGKSPKAAGDRDNPMKRVKMFFKEPDYYIHGTDDEDSLGRAESHGCLRMHVEDVTQLAQLVMEHGGKPMPEPWYRRIFRRKTTTVVYLTAPIAVAING
jgi:lipoprotein-anchoring transpeptidase ErfK/SrfK